jgi:hypothetical protein
VSDIIRDLQLRRCSRPHPGCPRPPSGPPPLCPPTPRAEPGRLHPPSRRPPASNLRRRRPGPRAACTPAFGLRRLGDRGLAKPGPPGLLPATAWGATQGRGAPAKRWTPGSPGRCVSRWAPAGTEVNPFAATSRRSHPRSTPPPPRLPLALLPPPPGAQPPVRPALRPQLAASPRPAEVRGLPGGWKLGRCLSR